MPASALGLALAAALLHAVWNLLLARSRDVEAATAVALVVAALAFAPAAVLAWDVERAAIPYVVASAALELAYFALLAAAYRRADLSLVYPLARGLAPVLVLVVGAAALSAEPGPAEIAAVLVIALGVVLVRGPRRPGDVLATGLALAIAACIAAYTLVDNAGLEHAAALPYLELVLAGPALAYAGAVVAAKGRRALRAEVRLSAGAAGLAMFGAYALVLAALARAPAAPVAAVRETSVVIAAILAAFFLREQLTRLRLAGTVLVALGIALLAVA
jgi:drug/metabolite transporter (DMT)-like permease